MMENFRTKIDIIAASHYSWALRNALEIVHIPVIEAYIGNIFPPEDFAQGALLILSKSDSWRALDRKFALFFKHAPQSFKGVISVET